MICSQCMSVSIVGSEKTCFTAFLYESPSLVLGNPPVFRRWRTRNFSWWTYHFLLFILIFPSSNPHLSWNHPLFHSTIWLLNISMEHFPGPFMDDFPICTPWKVVIFTDKSTLFLVEHRNFPQCLDRDLERDSRRRTMRRACVNGDLSPDVSWDIMGKNMGKTWENK